MRAAVLDMGSTSFHLLVADIGDDIVEVHRERSYLELGAMLARNGRFTKEVMEEAVAVAADFHRQARDAGAEAYVALATSAIRDARNGAELAARLNAETPWVVRVIDGDEEARLVFLGQQEALTTYGGVELGLDLGGGSLELAFESAGGLVTVSLPFGVGRVTAALGDSDPADPAELAAVADAVSEALVDYQVDLPETTTAGISGGSIRALARVLMAEQASDRDRDDVNGFTMETEDVAGLAERLSVLTRVERAALPSAGRKSETLHVAAIVVAAAADALGLERLLVSEWGLREGALLEVSGLAATDDDPSQRRRRAMARWVASHDGDLVHGQHVAGVASWLFQLTRSHHGLGSEDEERLELAAMAHSAMCTHEGSDDRRTIAALRDVLPRGFSPDDVELVCSVLKPRDRRSPDNTHTVRVLSALLQVADALDADREKPIRQLRLVDAEDGLRLLADGTGDVQAACTNARTGAKALAELLGRRLVVTPYSA